MRDLNVPRDEIVARAIRLRDEMKQIFIDADHWNRTRGADEERIDPDPTGELQASIDVLGRIIYYEPIAPGNGRKGE